MLACKLLSDEEHEAAEAERMKLGKSRGNDAAWLAANQATYGWASFDEIVPPGSMWFSRWYFDPNDPDDQPRRNAALVRIASGVFDPKKEYLSKFYWLSWSTVRPPISVLCPNGREWCVDACSSNGDGWQVTGAAPLIVCNPSIDVTGYHGFLGMNDAPPGHFTPDLAGRGPNGMGLRR